MRATLRWPLDDCPPSEPEVCACLCGKRAALSLPWVWASALESVSPGMRRSAACSRPSSSCCGLVSAESAPRNPSCWSPGVPSADVCLGVSRARPCLAGSALEEASGGCITPGGTHVLTLALVVTRILEAEDDGAREGFVYTCFKYFCTVGTEGGYP